MTVPKKFFLNDLLLTLTGIVVAVLALVCAVVLSGGIRQDLDSVQREGSASRVLAVLSALDQELQHLTDYTTGYAMWDDSYAYVQKPTQEFLDTNYSPSVMFVSPARLVAIYDLQRRVLFSRALDEKGNSIPVPREITAPEFTARFAALDRNQDSLGTMAWMEDRGYLLTVCPITDSAGTAPVRGYLLFGSTLDAKIMGRVKALTGVDAVPAPLDGPLRGGVEMETPTLGVARLVLDPPADGYVKAEAAFVDTRGVGRPVMFHMEVPSRLSGPAQRLSTTTRTLLLVVAGMFAAFVFLVWIETTRRRAELRARALESARLREAKDEADRLRVKAESADRAKSTFLAMMSHEIRTPLNAIIGYAELLRGVSLDRDAMQGIQAIRESGDVLLRVLNDVLDFSRIEAGGLAIRPEPTGVRTLVAEVCALFGAAAEARGNRLSFDVDAAVPPVLLMDGGRVRQVLSNLISNAVKFTNRGAVRVLVTWESERLDFRVEDEGIGVPREAESGLFQPFVQVDSAVGRRFDGSGLGLAICRRLCQLMGGEIAFRRRESGGSIFSFYLPATVSAAPGKDPPRVAAVVPDGDTFDGDAPSVLVVDDNVINARLMASILKRFGVTPRIAGGGREAVQSYRGEPADIILMDIQMPDMDGLEATREIRRFEGEQGLARSEIVAVTADILERHREEARAAGMDGYISKPVDVLEIQRLVSGRVRV